MTFKKVTIVSSLLMALSLVVAAQEQSGNMESATVVVGRHSAAPEATGTPGTGTPGHPFRIVARHPKEGCVVTEECGDVFYTYQGHNLRTAQGTKCQCYQMNGNTASCNASSTCGTGNWLGLSNSAVTPGEADSTLSGELNANGITRQTATVTFTGGTLTAPAAPTTVVTGTTGTAVFYYVEACNQTTNASGATPTPICTTVSTASASTSVASTLNATNYVTVSWTPVSGAAGYVVIRSNSGTQPSGAQGGGALLTSVGQVHSQAGTMAASCQSTTTCSIVDNSNTVDAVTVGTTANTNFGAYTLVKTWTASTSATSSIQAYGVFDAAFGAGAPNDLIFEGTFSSVSLNIGDTFQLTETVYFGLIEFAWYAFLLSTIAGLFLLARRGLQRRPQRS